MTFARRSGFRRTFARLPLAFWAASILVGCSSEDPVPAENRLQVAVRGFPQDEPYELRAVGQDGTKAAILYRVPAGEKLTTMVCPTGHYHISLRSTRSDRTYYYGGGGTHLRESQATPVLIEADGATPRIEFGFARFNLNLLMEDPEGETNGQVSFLLVALETGELAASAGMSFAIPVSGWAGSTSMFAPAGDYRLLLRHSSPSRRIARLWKGEAFSKSIRLESGADEHYELREGPPATLRFQIQRPVGAEPASFSTAFYDADIEDRRFGPWRGRPVDIEGSTSLAEVLVWPGGAFRVRASIRTPFSINSRWVDSYDESTAHVFDPAGGDVLDIDYPTAEVAFTIWSTTIADSTVFLELEPMDSESAPIENATRPHLTAKLSGTPKRVVLSNVLPGRYRILAAGRHHGVYSIYYPDRTTTPESSPIWDFKVAERAEISWAIEPPGP